MELDSIYRYIKEGLEWVGNNKDAAIIGLLVIAAGSYATISYLRGRIWGKKEPTPISGIESSARISTRTESTFSSLDRADQAQDRLGGAMADSSQLNNAGSQNGNKSARKSQ